MASLLDLLFGCTHRKYSFPITIKPGQRRSAAASITGTYVVCINCGKEMPYDWQTMKIVSARPQRATASLTEAAGSFAAK
jgi:hypothetical protein